MNEIIPGELWFEIARRDFSVWRALTKTIRIFWLYIQKIGRERIVEKLFGNTKTINHIHVVWFIADIEHRFGGLPCWIEIYNYIRWDPKDRFAGRNLIYINNFYMKVIKPSCGIREMWCYYDGDYIIGDVVHSPYDSSTNHSNDMTINLQETYFRLRVHRYAIKIIGKSGMLTYYDCSMLRNQDLPRFLYHDGTFSPIL